LLILPYLGYVVSVILLIGSVSVFMGAKADLKTVGVAVGAAVVLYGIFVFVLSIPLPPGFWAQLFN
jgi:putative tricarboxylic transport membrane protein